METKRAGMGAGGVVTLLLVAAFTGFALYKDWKRALPLVGIELMCLSCLGCAHISSGWQLGTSAGGSSPLLIPAGLIGFAAHIGVLWLLGTRSHNAWIAVGGLSSIYILGFLASSDRKSIKWRTVLLALMLQFWIGVLQLRTPAVWVTQQLCCKVNELYSHANVGATFIFGDTMINTFAFSVFPIVLYFSAISRILTHTGVLGVIFETIGAMLSGLLAVGEPEALITVANVRCSQRGLYLTKELSRSAIFTVMVAGFGSVAGSVLGAYIAMGVEPLYLLTACVMNAPAALALSKLVMPDAPLAAPEESAEEGKANNLPPGEPPMLATSHRPSSFAKSFTPAGADEPGAEPVTKPGGRLKLPRGDDANVIEAAAGGAIDAMPIIFAIGASVLAFLSMISLLNSIVGWLGSLVDVEGLTFELILGYIHWPIAYMMGVRQEDCYGVGRLIGIKLVANEFVAYAVLTGDTHEDYVDGLNAHSKIVATYALCGFSNLGSMGITIGALSAIAPSIRSILVQDVLKALACGACACFSTACIASCLLDGVDLDTGGDAEFC